MLLLELSKPKKFSSLRIQTFYGSLREAAAKPTNIKKSESERDTGLSGSVIHEF